MIMELDMICTVICITAVVLGIIGLRVLWGCCESLFVGRKA